MISRRTALAATVASLAPVAALGAASSDAELIALCRQYLAIEAEYDRLFDLQCEAEEEDDKATKDVVSAQISGLVPKLGQVLGDLMEVPATTAEGLRMKARVMLKRVQEDSEGNCLGQEDHVMWSVANDILAMTGGQP